MPQPANEPLDFEYWRQLAETSPEAFERAREAAIEALIGTSPAEVQERLRRLQWRIDRTRERASNPVAACIALSRMMWDNYDRLNATLQRLAHPEAGHRPPAGPGPATVLAFRPA